MRAVTTTNVTTRPVTVRAMTRARDDASAHARRRRIAGVDNDGTV